MRTETDFQKESTYRARVERHRGTATRWSIRRVDGWRYVVERAWSQIPTNMRSEEHWRTCESGRIVGTEDEAERQADAWLDGVRDQQTRRGNFR